MSYTSGLSVNGVLEAGSSTPVPQATGENTTLPFSFTVTLADGDQYHFSGSTAQSNAGGGTFSFATTYYAQYIADGHGGVSQTDTLSLSVTLNWDLGLSSINLDEYSLGSWGGGIASGSNISFEYTNNGVTEPVLGPYPSPATIPTTAQPASVTTPDGDLLVNVVATIVFAAGSPVGSYYTDGPIPCFCQGTRLLTIDGEVSVESLAEGDFVVTMSADAGPVIWIGHRRIDCRRHPDLQAVLPVRIQRGTFGDDLPRRDLYVSPDHAIYADGVLIPIRYLLNGTTIAQENRDDVTYFHVELERHAVIFAEGLTCESYLDAGDRANFANGGSSGAIHPDIASLKWEAAGCAPLVVTGPKLEAVRNRINDHANATRASEPVWA